MVDPQIGKNDLTKPINVSDQLQEAGITCARRRFCSDENDSDPLKQATEEKS